MAEPQPGADDASLRAARNIGVGCFTFVIGGASGSMIGVLVGKFVEAARGCTPVEGIPVCNWHVYAGWGALIGAISLPVLVLRRLRQSDEGRGPATRG